jgi:hypothetical protein
LCEGSVKDGQEGKNIRENNKIPVNIVGNERDKSIRGYNESAKKQLEE